MASDGSMEREGKEGHIGEMNGKWGFLFKLVLITTPAAWAIFITVDLPWRIWVTKTTFQSTDTHEALREVSADIAKLVDQHQRDIRELDRQLKNQPPQEWRDRIAKLEDWERENKADHLRILVSLEAIKARLEIPATPLYDAPRDRLQQEGIGDDTSSFSSTGGSRSPCIDSGT